MLLGIVLCVVLTLPSIQVVVLIVAVLGIVPLGSWDGWADTNSFPISEQQQSLCVMLIAPPMTQFQSTITFDTK